MISVIITAYNSEKYVARAVSSVQSQICKVKYEIIVVDDGSYDNTHKILKQFSNIRYIFKKNRGPSSARNLGIENSKYDLICFLDSDDFWEPNKLSMQFNSFKEYPEASIFTCNSYIINNHKKVGLLNDPKKIFLDSNIQNGIVTNYLRSTGRYSFHQPSSIMIKKELFNKYGYFSDKYIGVEDSEIFMRWALNEEVIYYQNDILSNYETSNEGSLTKNYLSWSQNHFQYWLDLEKFTLRNPKKNKLFKKMRKETLLNSILILIKNFQSNLAKDYLLKYFSLLFGNRWIYIFFLTLIPVKILKKVKYAKNLYNSRSWN